MKRMLINATQPEERRLAIVDGQKLLDFETEIEGREQRKGNIYKAVVTRVEPSLEACFVDYGEDRHGFLPFKEISQQLLPRRRRRHATRRIQDAIREGAGTAGQVEKEERGNKGAALTTLRLAGRPLPGADARTTRAAAASARRIEGEDREELKENLDQLEYPKGMSLIARTAGIGRSRAGAAVGPELHAQAVDARSTARAKAGKGAFLIYQESSLVIRAIRDYFTAGHRRDPDRHRRHLRSGAAVHEPRDARVGAHVSSATATTLRCSSRFQIEHQIETAFSRTGQPAVGRRDRDRPHRGAGVGRRQLGARRPAAATSRRPPPAPTSKPPTRSRARCGCATSAA
mgnify:CR=1 FL=1